MQGLTFKLTDLNWVTAAGHGQGALWGSSIMAVLCFSAMTCCPSLGLGCVGGLSDIGALG